MRRSPHDSGTEPTADTFGEPSVDPHLLRVIRSHPHGILVVSSDSGRIVHSNPVARRLLRGDPDAPIHGEVLGIPVIGGRSVLVEIGPPNWRRLRMSVEDVAWGGRLARFVTLRHPRVSSRARSEPAGGIDSRRARALLSHELRAPLASMLGSIYAARLDPGRIQDALSMVEHQARRLGQMLSDLIGDSGPDGRSLAIRPVPIPLDGIAEWSIEAVRPILEDRGQRLEINLPGEPIRLLGDPTWIEQALFHLLSNASKYSNPGGRILLEASRVGQEVVIQVRDEGIGIAPQDVEQLFEPFQRGDAEGVRLREGQGIGLAMVRRIVQRHGGTISANSPGLGLGSTFCMSLPMAIEEPRRSLDSTDGGSRPPLSDWDGPVDSVLIVDDDRSSAESLALVLRLWGLEVRTCFDGQSALDEALARPPRFLVIDRGLPGLDGEALARRLRAAPEMAGSVLICLSGSNQGAGRADDPFDHRLLKPVDFDTLSDLMASTDPNPHPSTSNP